LAANSITHTAVFTMWRYASVVYAVVACLCVCMCACPSHCSI